MGCAQSAVTARLAVRAILHGDTGDRRQRSRVYAGNPNRAGLVAERDDLSTVGLMSMTNDNETADEGQRAWEIYLRLCAVTGNVRGGASTTEVAGSVFLGGWPSVSS
jgi:hypothetical protein